MLCLPKSIGEKITAAIKSGDIPLEKLYDMSDSERHTVFEHYVGKDSASLVNSEFEKAMVAADKRAKADYITASDKKSFKKTATAGEFAKKLLSDEQAKKVTIKKLEDKIEALKKQQDKIEVALKEAEGESKANLELKLKKVEDKVAQLNVKKEDTVNPVTDRLLKKINDVKGLLSPEEEAAHHADLVTEKMGQNVSPAQGKYIVDKATELQAMIKDGKDTVQGVTPEYLNARNLLDSYIENLNPKSAGMSIIKNLVEISRNNLITSIATPLKTFVSGVTNNLISKAVQRISHLSITGDNYALAKEINNSNADFRAKTGIEPSTLDSINDAGSVLGNHKSEGKISSEFGDVKKTGVAKGALGVVDTAVGKVAQVSHYVAINLEHTIMFNKIYNSAFSDTLNFRASDIAKAEGLPRGEVKARAAEIMRDAAKIEPETEAGKVLRRIAQEQAAKVLNVNNTWASRFSVGTKNMLNNIHPDIPIGNLIEPIAKIPANIIANGIETTPVGIPKGIWDVVKGKINIGSEDLDIRYKGMEQYRNGVEQLIKIVGSVGVAAIITSNLTKDDFRSDQYGTHFIKVGDTWINTEYFSLISPNIAGMMAMKQNAGKGGVVQDTKQFLTGNGIGQGALGDILNIPGVDVGSRTIQSILGNSFTKDLTAQVENRALPAGIQNMFKDRPINRLFFGANGVESVEQVKADDEAKSKKAAATRKANARAKLGY